MQGTLTRASLLWQSLPFICWWNNGIILPINVSHNLQTPVTMILDYGPSIVLWVMDDVACKNCNHFWYSIILWRWLMAMREKGLMIKISDGMIMSFQGNTLCHGTTIHWDAATGNLCPTGNIFGIYFGLSMPTLTSFWWLQIDQYIHNINLQLKMVIHEEGETTKPEHKNSKHGKRI